MDSEADLHLISKSSGIRNSFEMWQLQPNLIVEQTEWKLKGEQVKTFTRNS